MAKNTHAGAGTDQPLPSRKGGRFDASHPLHSFLDKLDTMREAMDACGAPAFAFSTLNVLPKIALGKLSVRDDLPGVLALVSPDDACRIVPTADRASYWNAVLSLLEAKHNLALVPDWAAQALKRVGYKVAKQHEEYVMATPDVMDFPGGRNRQMRGNVNKARRLCTVETYNPDNAAEYKALVRTWYRQNADIKFRTYDKTSIDWMLESWGAIVEADPQAVCLGIRHEGQLISLNVGGLLTATTWTAYTQRFDRNAPIKHGNMLGYQSLAHHFSSVPLENDGTADTKTIREWKDRLVTHKIPFYTVTA